MLRHGFASGLLRETDAGNAWRLAQFHHVHTGKPAGAEQVPGGFGAVEPRQQHAHWPMRQVVTHEALFFLTAVVVITDQHLDTAGAHHFMNRL